MLLSYQKTTKKSPSALAVRKQSDVPGDVMSRVMLLPVTRAVRSAVRGWEPLPLSGLSGRHHRSEYTGHQSWSSFIVHTSPTLLVGNSWPAFLEDCPELRDGGGDHQGSQVL